MTKRIATVVSWIFEPITMFFCLFVLTFIRGNVTGVFIWIVSAALLIGVPLALILIALRKKIVSNWDVSERRQRPKVLVVLLAWEAANVFILRVLVPSGVLTTFLFLLTVLVGFTLITLRWKISGHALAAALASGMIVSWYGWRWWPLLSIVPLVGWARVVRRDHTVGQVVAGAAYPWILIGIFTKFFTI